LLLVVVVAVMLCLSPAHISQCHASMLHHLDEACGCRHQHLKGGCQRTRLGVFTAAIRQTNHKATAHILREPILATRPVTPPPRV
jgi:hypothetical protein